MCSIYLALGAAIWTPRLALAHAFPSITDEVGDKQRLTLIFVPPFTLFSKDDAMCLHPSLGRGL
jgi:hypothetical protein